MSHVRRRTDRAGRYQTRWIDPDGRSRSRTFKLKRDADRFAAEMRHR